MPPKILKVLGDSDAGKKTLLGGLFHQCGTDLTDIESMEKNGVCSYGEIVPFLKRQGKAVSFNGPSSLYVAQDGDAGDTHVVFWVVDATATDHGKSSSERLASMLSAGGLQPQEQLVIVANKMDANNWSEQVFAKIVRSFQHIDSKSFKPSIVPVSSLPPDNLLESPEKAPWVKSISPSRYSGCNLVTAQPLMLLL